MLDLGLQVLGLVWLLSGVAWGYRRWIQPRATRLDRPARGLLLLVVLTLMGGAIGSPFWWVDEERSFAWDLTAPVSRILAVAGWSFVVVSYFALRRPARQRLRLVLCMLMTYLAPLALAIVLFHRNRFDFSAPITYAFFAIAVGMLLATLGYLWRWPAVFADEPGDRTPAPRMTRGWLLLLALLTGIWGVALFLTDGSAFWPVDGSFIDPYAASSPTLTPQQRLVSYIWAWPGDLLTSRLIGVMLLAIAVGSLVSFRYADVAQVMLATTLTYGLGVALAGLWNQVLGQPILLSYVIAFGVIGVGSTLLWVYNRLVFFSSASSISA